jgi:hypothetical protein
MSGKLCTVTGSHRSGGVPFSISRGDLRAVQNIAEGALLSVFRLEARAEYRYAFSPPISDAKIYNSGGATVPELGRPRHAIIAWVIVRWVAFTHQADVMELAIQIDGIDTDVELLCGLTGAHPLVARARRLSNAVS